MWNNFCTFASQNAKVTKIMTTAMTMPRYDQVVVNIPHLEMKRFTAIAKALGVTIEKQSSMDCAMAQIESGQIYDAASVEDLIKIVG